MKALKLSSENQRLLVELLTILFAEDYTRVEVNASSQEGVIVILSNVGKFNPLNFLAGNTVNSEIPLLELFMREIPEQLSIYATGGRSWTPVFVWKLTLMGRSTGDNLVKFLEKTMKKVQRPIDRNDYSIVEAQADMFGNLEREEKMIEIIKASSSILGDDVGLTKLLIRTQSE